MAIPYSLRLASSVPGTLNSPKRVYPVAQAEKISTDQFIEHLEEHGVMTRSEAARFIVGVEKCIKELLLDGKSVDLGFLGKYAVTLKSEGADKAEHFVPAMISGAKMTVVHYGEKKWLKDAQFTFVPSREEQTLARKASKANLDAQLTPGGSGNNGGNLED